MSHQVADRGYVAEPNEYRPSTAYVLCTCGQRFCASSPSGTRKLLAAGVAQAEAERITNEVAQAAAERFYWREHGLQIGQLDLF